MHSFAKKIQPAALERKYPSGSAETADDDEIIASSREMRALDDLLADQEPYATFQDAIVVAIKTDYVRRRFVADMDLRVGDPRAGEEARSRRRRGQLVVENVRLWALEPPDRTHRAPKGLLLKQAGPLAEAPTETGATLAVTVGTAGFSWFLFFDDLQAFAYLAGDRAQFTWS
jgi:hypothetical protein